MTKLDIKETDKEFALPESLSKKQGKTADEILKKDIGENAPIVLNDKDFLALIDFVETPLSVEEIAGRKRLASVPMWDD